MFILSIIGEICVSSKHFPDETTDDGKLSSKHFTDVSTGDSTGGISPPPLLSSVVSSVESSVLSSVK